MGVGLEIGKCSIAGGVARTAVGRRRVPGGDATQFVQKVADRLVFARQCLDLRVNRRAVDLRVGRRGELADHRKQHLLLALEMRLEISTQLVVQPLHLR